MWRRSVLGRCALTKEKYQDTSPDFWVEVVRHYLKLLPKTNHPTPLLYDTPLRWTLSQEATILYMIEHGDILM